MSAPKTLQQWGFMAKEEAIYGTPVALAAASDGILLAEIPEPGSDEYIHDGSRGRTPAGAMNRRVNQSGRQRSLRAVAHGIGGGAAYSASIFPSIHRLLKGSGLEATLDATVSAEKYRYAPETGPTGLDSLTMEAYVAGQLYKMYGAYGSFEVGVEGPGVPDWEFEFLGLTDRPTDAAIPSITSYPPASRLPPKAESISLVLGLFTGAVVRSFRFNPSREHDAQRADINSAGHKGFTPAARNPQLVVVIERTATLATVDPWSTASTLNPYALKDEEDVIICSLNVGSVQYNRWKIFAGNPTSAAQAQIVDVQDGEDAGATWEITLEFKPSAYTANDEFTIQFD